MGRLLPLAEMCDDVFFAYIEALGIAPTSASHLLETVTLPRFDAKAMNQSLARRQCVACTCPCPPGRYHRFEAVGAGAFYICAPCQGALGL